MRKDLSYIHGAVLLFGLSGLFGKWIQLPAFYIVLGRVFFAALFLAFILCHLGKSLKLNKRKDYIPFIVIGGLLALHWGSFFHSIQISTVAVGLVTFATFPIFASILEPVFLNEIFQKRSFMLGMITLLGVVLLVPEIDFSNDVTRGVLWGLVSAVTFAILSVLNRKYVQQNSSIQIGFYQNSFAFIWLIPFVLLLGDFSVSFIDISLLLLLGIVFTGGAHVLFIQGLRRVNVRTASIIASLEPVYGITAAVLFLEEIPVLREWLGILIILSAVIYAGWNVEKNRGKTRTGVE